MLPSALIDVELGEAKVDHVDDVIVRGQADDAVAELDVAVQHAARVHAFESGDLGGCVTNGM